MSSLMDVKDTLVFLNPSVYFLLKRHEEERGELPEPITIGGPKAKVIAIGEAYSGMLALKITGDKTYYFDYDYEDNTIVLYIGKDLTDFDRKDNINYLQSIFDDVLLPFMRDYQRGVLVSQGSVVHNTVGKNYTIYLNHNYNVIYKK